MKNKIQVMAILALLPLLSYAQGGRNFDAVQVEVKEVQGNIYMLVEEEVGDACKVNNIHFRVLIDAGVTFDKKTGV